ncbi:hypothetical protein BDV96DRAFT_655439 [Lophiotrema nucula]|uniref:Uncharacterized protein n=1 Tax=Lophiotrema nucula TaxID=690887 RepID=A0A6A5YH48_9PLEO|nr:hypothetical protein BDV96DRAFT_655439 [Lophiotrema nucula]
MPFPFPLLALLPPALLIYLHFHLLSGIYYRLGHIADDIRSILDLLGQMVNALAEPASPPQYEAPETAGNGDGDNEVGSERPATPRAELDGREVRILGHFGRPVDEDEGVVAIEERGEGVNVMFCCLEVGFEQAREWGGAEEA